MHSSVNYRSQRNTECHRVQHSVRGPRVDERINGKGGETGVDTTFCHLQNDQEMGPLIASIPGALQCGLTRPRPAHTEITCPQFSGRRCGLEPRVRQIHSHVLLFHCQSLSLG
jgi:hypothetical protein